MDTNCIHTGDSFEVLDSLEENSVHAIVTDPPYGLNFMGKDWDNFRRRKNKNDVGRDDVGGRLSAKAPASGAETDGKRYQQWCEKWSRKALRVLKPGGHILAFSGNRTHHRLFSGVEDAGFEIRDTITWHYGSGFPKALDVSKAIDKAAGAEREVVATREADDFRGNAKSGTGGIGTKESDEAGTMEYEYTAPATDSAKKWEGWKTALKPATEYVVLGRKELSESTVAENMQTHGTGALNIGATRIGHNEECKVMAAQKGGDKVYRQAGRREETLELKPEGRYPSNVIFDETQAKALDDEVGETGGGDFTISKGGREDPHDDWEATKGMFSADRENVGVRDYGDSGGPSRYFYTSKASKAERTLNGSIDNSHPTVKPIDLMEYLIKLVTAENQIILDPFCGSGTTCKAAKNLNRRFIGIEKQAKWADVARVRCGLTPDDPSVVRSDENQAGLESF